MTKRFFKVLGVSTLLAAAFSMSAFADEAITSVSFACGPDAEASVGGSGTIESPVFVLNDVNATYELSSYSDSNPESNAYKTARTYEIVFDAADGYYFAPSDQITATGKGITSIVSKKVDKNNPQQLIVKCKAFPYYVWAAPEPKEMTEKTISFTRPAGATIEYVIDWTNQGGDQKIVHSTTNGTSINISSYNKKLTEAQQKRVNEDGDDLRDAEINGIAVRAKGNAGDNTRTAPSEWVNLYGSVDVSDIENSDKADTWGDLFEGVSAVGGTGSSGSSSSVKGPSAGKLNGWNPGLGGSWYYYENGTAKKGWFWDGSNWYYLHPTTGMMQTGWVIDGGKKYYCNPNAGGPQGAMVTGTHVIDGQTCTFDASGALQ